MMPLLIASVALQQAAMVLNAETLVWWGENEFHWKSGQYMALYASMGVAQALFTFTLGALACVMGNNASRNLYSSAIARVLHAPMSFFDTHPLGAILGRFAKDTDTIDNQLNDSARVAILTLSSVYVDFSGLGC